MELIRVPHSYIGNESEVKYSSYYPTSPQDSREQRMGLKNSSNMGSVSGHLALWYMGSVENAVM